VAKRQCHLPRPMAGDRRAGEKHIHQRGSVGARCLRARDAYIAAADAYKAAGANADGTAKTAAQTKLDGLVAALVSVTTNVAAFRTAHAGAQ